MGVTYALPLVRRLGGFKSHCRGFKFDLKEGRQNEKRI